ncbi:diguanylate cyclase [Paraburkholderia sp. Se-20369]|nr:diguanylate cyclase [Paraburkholderia sp. Se-20369]
MGNEYRFTERRSAARRRWLSAAGALILSPAGVLGCAVLLWLGTAGLCSAMLLVAREDAFHHAIQNAQNLTLILERDILRSIESYDLSLQAVAEGAVDPRIMALPMGFRDQILFDRATTAQYFAPISVFAPDGRLIASSAETAERRRTASDVKWFLEHAEKAASGLYLSPPYASDTAGGEMVIALSRKVMRPDGTLAGVVVGRLSLDYCRGLLDGVSVGKDGTIAVLETNGALITRLPYDPKRVGQNVGRSPIFARIAQSPAGAFVGTSVIDGVRRLFVYRRIPGLPIIVDVAPAIDEVFSDWRLRAKWLASLMVLFTAAIVAGTWVLLRELKRRQRAEAQLQRMAHRDAMTGLQNRGTFDAVWSREWRRASRSGQPLSLLFIDIDCFKAYNDHYGHQAGDQVLKAVAQCLAACVARATDHVARYGGEEFVVVLPATDLKGSLSVAEAVRAAIHGLDIAHVKSPFGRVTASIGVASSGGRGIDSGAALVKAADMALYDAKSGGRNRVCGHVAAHASQS